MCGIKKKKGMIKMLKKKFVETKGITLVALVITIIILLILATVSIDIVFKEDGIIDKSQNLVEGIQDGQATNNRELKNLINELNEDI